MKFKRELLLGFLIIIVIRKELVITLAWMNFKSSIFKIHKKLVQYLFYFCCTDQVVIFTATVGTRRLSENLCEMR